MQMVRICVYHEYADVRHMDMFSLCYFLSFPVQIRFLVKSEPTISEYLISQFLYPFAFIIFLVFRSYIAC